MTSTLDYVEQLPESVHRYSIIWIHGLGADGHDFAGITPALDLHEAGVHFIFPHAPLQPVTINGGMVMRAWYDILEMTLTRKVDEQGIYASSDAIHELIHMEINKGIPSENIVLAGFSQGGVIALHAGLRFPQKLGGIVALSTYLPTIPQLETEAAETNKTTPILMVHGTADPVVEIQAGKMARDGLVALGYPVQWLEFGMQHEVIYQEIEAIKKFLKQCFNQ